MQSSSCAPAQLTHTHTRFKDVGTKENNTKLEGKKKRGDTLNSLLERLGDRHPVGQLGDDGLVVDEVGVDDATDSNHRQAAVLDLSQLQLLLLGRGPLVQVKRAVRGYQGGKENMSTQPAQNVSVSNPRDTSTHPKEPTHNGYTSTQEREHVMLSNVLKAEVSGLAATIEHVAVGQLAAVGHKLNQAAGQENLPQPARRDLEEGLGGDRVGKLGSRQVHKLLHQHAQKGQHGHAAVCKS